MQNKIEINLLLDHYGGLLTLKQQEICRYYYREDYSYQEIAEIVHTSRAAVYDTVKRCITELNQYESILKMTSSSKKRIALYEKIKASKDSKEISKYIDACYETEAEGGSYE